LRDSLYEACEAHANGAMSDEDFARAQANIMNALSGVFTVEQLAQEAPQ
jgi:hypothetical protein